MPPTETAPSPLQRTPHRAPLAHRLLGSPFVLLAAAAAVGLMLAWRYLRDPQALAPTRDPAWYTWRTQLLLEDEPALLVTKQGPFTALSGGYRVTAPVIGALLHRVGGVHPYTFTKLLVIGVPVLTGLALAAFVYRHRGDPVAYLLMLLTAVGLLLTSPFIGYLDNVISLWLLATALPFLEPARTSWGARTAVGVVLFLVTMSHPTTAAIFVLAVGLMALVRLPTTGFSLRRTLAADGPMVASALAGLVLGFAVWRLGLWGASAPVSDAVLTQPYPSAFFRARLRGWFENLSPGFVLPLGAAAVAWIVLRAVRRREVDTPARLSLAWLVPLVGTLGYLLELTYPYYRFINTTLAPVLLAGTGAWVLSRAALWLGARAGERWGVLQVAVGAVLVAVIASTYYEPGLRRLASESEFIGRPTRLTMAAVRAYLEEEPGRPVVFVVKPKPTIIRAWGLAKQYIDIQFAGLAGDQIGRSFVYAGEVDRLLADEPTVTGNAIFDRVSRGYLADVRKGLAGFRDDPIVLYLRHFNRGFPETADLVEAVPNMFVVRGPGAAPPSPAAVSAAAVAYRDAERAQARPESRLAAPLHLVRVALGLAVLLLLPGLLAMRWLGIDRFATWLGVVPGISLGLTAACAVLVVAVHRAPFGSVDAWASVVLANGAAAAVGLARSRRPSTAPSPTPPDSRPPGLMPGPPRDENSY